MIRRRWARAAALGAVLAALPALFWAGASAQAPEPTVDAPQISVEGSAARVIEARATEIRWRTDVLRESAAEAARDGEAALLRVRAALLERGITDENLATTSVRLNTEWNYRGETPTISGYRWSSRLTLSVNGTDRAGALIDAIATAGGDEVGIDGVSFTAETGEQLERDLLLAAARDAQAQALAVARMLGFDTVRPIAIPSVVVGQAGPPIGPYPALDGDSASIGLAGPIRVVARMSVTFTLQRAPATKAG